MASTPDSGRVGPLRRGPLDLVATGDFTSVAGLETGVSGLTVRNLGRAILTEDGTGYLPDPPWVLAGTHLTISGGFTMTVELRDIGGEAAVLLAGRPPIVYDEFVNDRGSLRVSVAGSSARARLVSATSRQRAVEQRTWSVPAGSAHRLTIQFTGTLGTGTLRIGVDDRDPVSFPAHGLFASGQVWLGMEAATVNGSFRIPSWQVISAAGSKVAAVDTTPLRPGDQPGMGLQELATVSHPGFLIGAALSASSLYSDPAFARLALGGQIGLMTTENALKFQFIQPQRGLYEFREADALIQTARDNGLAVHGHTLVFGEAIPRWVRALPAADPTHMLGVMIDHIRTVVTHYAGRVRSWDVVNEPLADDPTSDGLRRNIWRRTIGARYIADAFTAAHEADPDAKLFVNEYGLEAHDERWATMRGLLERLIGQGVPIDGVGLQCHVYDGEDVIVADNLRRVLREIADLELTARISELDVFGDNPRIPTDHHQAEQFATVLRTCLEEPVCESLTFWGLSERYGSTSWLDNGQLEIGDGLPWDEQLRPLPAVNAMRTVLTS
ncbi:MAG: endo-1,4-beta-xylanase [Tetrasphaera sp.]